MKVNASHWSENDYLLMCECGEIDHSLYMSRCDKNTLFVNTYFRYGAPFWTRLITGIKYIFGIRQPDGCMDMLVHVDRLQHWIDYLRKVQNESGTDA